MSFWEIISGMLPLILLIALLFGALVLVKRYSFSINGRKSKLLKIEVLNNQMILPKKYLSVVKVEDKVLLLGISENNITLIKEYEFDESMEIDNNLPVDKGSFVDILKQNLGIK
ncbi:MAG: flagellar biosynthetic protein FliO [Melioribacteraceae bacterium]|nr:flagellar biosynthetic protein FliO [Melioribacteraceae bacterium]